MGFSDSFYKKVERKTNVNKETILSLAKKLQGDNLKDSLILFSIYLSYEKCINVLSFTWNNILGGAVSTWFT